MGERRAVLELAELVSGAGSPCQVQLRGDASTGLLSLAVNVPSVAVGVSWRVPSPEDSAWLVVR